MSVPVSNEMFGSLNWNATERVFKFGLGSSHDSDSIKNWDWKPILPNFNWGLDADFKGALASC